MEIGRITGRQITTNRDGTKPVTMLQVEITDPEDLQTIELMNSAGEDSQPPDDSRIVILSIGQAYKIAVAVDDGIAPDAALIPGERKIYSSDGGVIKAFITWLKTGAMTISGTILSILGSTSISQTAPIINQTGATSINLLSPLINLNGVTDNAVAFTDLKIAFDLFKADYNAHTHVPGPGVTTPTAADMTPAKVNSVTLP